MNRKVPSTRPRPSYEEGELRDKRIEALQDDGYEQRDLLVLVKRSVERMGLDELEMSRQVGGV